MKVARILNIGSSEHGTAHYWVFSVVDHGGKRNNMKEWKNMTWNKWKKNESKMIAGRENMSPV